MPASIALGASVVKTDSVSVHSVALASSAETIRQTAAVAAAPGIVHILDGDESDIDCGGTCPPCGQGADCVTVADCGDDLLCGSLNGGCFGRARAKNVCWPAECEDGIELYRVVHPEITEIPEVLVALNEWVVAERTEFEASPQYWWTFATITRDGPFMTASLVPAGGVKGELGLTQYDFAGAFP